VHTASAASEFWDRPYLTFTDSGLDPTKSYSYQIYAVDPNGNQVHGATASITPNGSVPNDSYVQRVVGDGATMLWRFCEGSGATSTRPVYDWAGGADGVAGTGVVRGAAGPVSGDTAGTFGGSASSTVVSPYTAYGPKAFSVQAWIKTTSAAGGAIVGFGDAVTGLSKYFDRALYLDSAGKVEFGMYPGSFKAVASPTTLRDGQWHQVTGTFVAGAMKLYIDGALVAQRTDVTSGWYQYGSWRVGGDLLTGYPAKPTSNYLNGAIDEVAVYPLVLTAAQVEAQYNLARGDVDAVAPAVGAPAAG
jgi:hypothetical protein